MDNPIVDLDGDEMTRVSRCFGGKIEWDRVKVEGRWIVFMVGDSRSMNMLNHYSFLGYLGFHQGKAYSTLPRPKN